MSANPAIHAGAVYVPRFRLKLEGSEACRSVASYDEDATSMGVEAARRVLVASRPKPERLLFACCDPGYLEKNLASTIHAATGLAPDIGAYDAGSAYRSGIGALVAALGSRSPTLVVAADLQVGLPGSTDERERGDGAAAVLTGPANDSPIAAELLGHAAVTLELMERWRLPGETTGQSSDERLLEDAYRDVTPHVVAGALSAAGIQAIEIKHAAGAGHTMRAVRAASGILPIAKQAWIPSLPESIGNTGVAHPLLQLLRLLEAARPGELVLLLVLADGADCLILRRGEAESVSGGGPAIASEFAGGRYDLPYLTYLTWRGLLPRPGSRRPDPPSVAPAPALRGRTWKFALVASRCSACGFVSMPPQEVCPGCMRRGTGVPYQLANRRGTVVTTNTDLLSRGPAQPPLMSAVIDFDGGGRGRFELTDVWADEVIPGSRIELTFRRLYSSGGVHDYFWKARPVADGRD